MAQVNLWKTSLLCTDLEPFPFRHITKIVLYMIVSPGHPCKFCDWLYDMQSFKGLLGNNKIPVEIKNFDWENPEDKDRLNKLKLQTPAIKTYPTMEIQTTESIYFIEALWLHNEKGYFIRPDIAEFWELIIA